jgi:transmembrane sensor
LCEFRKKLLSILIPNIAMTQEEFDLLYERCTSGKASLEEQQLFEESKDLFDLSDIPWTAEMGDYEATRQMFLKDLDQRIAVTATVKMKKWHWPVAASIVIAIGMGLLFIKYFDESREVKPVMAASAIGPGADKATLILSDGHQVLLKDSGKDLISKNAYVTISKDGDNTLTYQSNNQTEGGDKELFNTLITPRGGQYALVLADGTRVWLNADSKLVFPINFNGKERVVQLIGEAYFEVVKNKLKPFKVVTDQKTVEVLGTSFNVSAYRDEPYHATLLTGLVKMKFGSGPAVMLNPGNQATLNSKQSFEVSAVNAEDAIAWKKGVFLFKNENIQGVMQRIARWYDVDVDYKGDVYRKKLGGSVSRYENLDELLKTIELTGKVQFKIQGRRVTVMP